MDKPNEVEGASAAIVAVVDDEPAVLESVADLLESAGYAVRAFASAQEFLEGEVLPAIACLISDIRMPGMDGWELQTAVHAQRPDLPIVLITGQHEPDDSRVQFQQRHGCVLLLFKKPFDAQQLLDAVNEVVRPASA